MDERVMAIGVTIVIVALGMLVGYAGLVLWQKGAIVPAAAMMLLLAGGLVFFVGCLKR